MNFLSKRIDLHMAEMVICDDGYIRVRRIVAITPAFQAGDVGSIPIGRLCGIRNYVAWRGVIP